MKSLTDVKPGYHDLLMYIHKNTFDVTGGTLLSICNEGIQQGKFPDEVKIANITSIFESEERNIISNYRSISVLSSPSKIVEKVVIIQLSEYLNVNNIINSRQIGFQRAI